MVRSLRRLGLRGGGCCGADEVEAALKPALKLELELVAKLSVSQLRDGYELQRCGRDGRAVDLGWFVICKQRNQKPRNQKEVEGQVGVGWVHGVESQRREVSGVPWS